MRGGPWTKLVILATVLFGVAVLSAPTWSTLMFPGAGPPQIDWRTDQIKLHVTDPDVSMELLLESIYGPPGAPPDSESNRHEFALAGNSAHLRISFPLKLDEPPPLPGARTAYLVVTGQVARRLGKCDAQELSEEDATVQGFQSRDNSIRAFAIYGQIVSCDLPVEALWRQGSDGQKYYVSPAVSVEAPEAYRDTQPTSTLCASIIASYSGQATIAYQSAAPSTDARFTPSWGGAPPGSVTALKWESCGMAMFGDLNINDAAATLNDISESSAATRRTFIGGAAVGLIGALLVEIILALIELWNLRRKPVTWAGTGKRYDLDL